MNIPVVKKWIEALESGEYKQGQQSLKNSSLEYCCLGVLTDIYIKECNKGEWVDCKYQYKFKEGEIEEGIQLTPEICEWVGIKSTSGYCGITEEQMKKMYPKREIKLEVIPNGEISLMSLNDGPFEDHGPLTFKQIARVLRMKIKEYTK